MSSLTREAFMQAVAVELNRILDYIREQIREELQKQGHTLTGALEESIRNEIDILGNQVVGSMWINHYYKYVDQGVSADRIPFGGTGGGGGGTSKYIQALVEYAKIRMNISDEKEALSVAFAIAHTHKKQGMPTAASGAYSETGERKGFFKTALEDSEPYIQDGFSRMFGSAVDAVVAIYNSRVSGVVEIHL